MPAPNRAKGTNTTNTSSQNTSGSGSAEPNKVKEAFEDIVEELEPHAKVVRASAVVVVSLFVVFSVFYSTRIYAVGSGADSDGDGWSDSVENYLGTDPNAACPTNSSHAAWPPDLNNDRKVDEAGDLNLFNSPVQRINTKEGDANFSRRFDLNSEGSGIFGQNRGRIDISDMSIMVVPVRWLGQTCTPPAAPPPDPEPTTPPSGQLPDLVVGNSAASPVVTGPSKPKIGQAATYTVYVHNLGNGNSPSVKLNVSAAGSSNDNVTINIPPLNPGGTTGQLSYTTTWNSAGTRDVIFQVDPTYEVSELNERNNSAMIQVSVEGDPDLVVLNQYGQASGSIEGPTTLLVGQQGLFRARVKNVGTGTTPSFVTRISTTGSNFNNANITVSGLGPGQTSGFLEQPLKWSSPGTYTVQFTADQTSVVAESNEFNNTRSVQVVVTSPQTCTGNPTYSINGQTVGNITVLSNQSISVAASGAAGCGSSDKFVVRLWGFDGSGASAAADWTGWKDFGSCALTSSGTCNISFKVPNKQSTEKHISYPVQLVLDIGGNGLNLSDKYSGWPITLNVPKQEVTPPPPPPQPGPNPLPPVSVPTDQQVKDFITQLVGGKNVTVAVSGGGYYTNVNIGQFLWALARCESGLYPFNVRKIGGGDPNNPNHWIWLYESGLYQYQHHNIPPHPVAGAYVPNSLFATWESALPGYNASSGDNITVGDIWNWQAQIRVTNWKVRANGGQDVDAWACFTSSHWKTYANSW